MQLEDLNHSQLVLLAILASFITSIATGILTVSLLVNPDQNPSQVINRVVERTVEKIVPQLVVQTVTKEVPVPNTDGEKIVKTINFSSPAVVKLYLNSVDGTSLALNSGLILADQKLFLTSSSGLKDNLSYFLKTDADKKITLTWALIDKDKSIAIFRINDDSNNLAKIPVITFSKSNTTGQTVVGLGASESADNNPLSVGILLNSENASSTPNTLLRTNSANSDTLGGPVLNTANQLVGLVVKPGFVLPASSLLNLIDSLK
ncbi:MAG: hypothetical protein COX02_00420 [Candidatus Vogelbacteria bacterium CG22_combo_CG10-13_8_21_14_all_37_9]|uniref:Serine protease n=1 Tax=Candidatus Vogelbacteria bacterium CG22_combo_CG10-13_8_21_14_all_37_9 TaxID=1975046 RepID=A0A2H0BL71_9BACT|nr:MAG: hypothetical protein BK005_01370 [bacterium CG10_37_50]PIP58425.1 MAG: hypothetical protein COX02_00420 [Candidatus Vogelbacteria bacterium CG22_combo_CG10-13_8_21_14_all_37_9]